MTKARSQIHTNQVDAQLARYRAMRDFSTTAEPSGGERDRPDWLPKEGLPFVIQKHAATRLHYDFRLGWRGVLKSWACAKGPSYSTKDKRLAVEVEDHPMEYGGFEGAIPKGQYGGGTVLVWDQGTWEPLAGHDFDEGLRKGSLKFTLHGHKLEGRWTLVRMGGRFAKEGKPNWLLIKERDGQERPEGSPLITDEAPDSVVTGRSLEEIAAAEDHIWNSKPLEQSSGAPANRSRLQQKILARRAGIPVPAAAQTPARALKPPQAAPVQKQSTASNPSMPPALQKASKEAMPPFLPPQLATPANTIPPGSGWLHELKLDGYRIQAHIRAAGVAKGKREVVLYTRSGLDWTHRMRPVARACEQILVEQAVLDGELVILDERGQASFAKLQSAFENADSSSFTYFAFDLLHLNGRNLRGLPLHTRKELLEPLIAEAAAANESNLLAYSPHLIVSADEVYTHACRLGAEGILSKQVDAPYTAGRTESWLKLKCTHRQEFVVGGFTLPKDKGAGVGSLLLGYYAGEKFLHCGRCGTGFTEDSARELRQQLERLRAAKSPYNHALDALARRGAIYVRPELVCEVQFANWTADDMVRHASFQGLRADKPAAEVRREEAALPVMDSPSDEPRKKVGKLDEGETMQAPTEKRPQATATARAKSVVRLTHPDKVLDAATGTTKQQMADYYQAVAPVLLPHLAGRPVSIVRCPDGSEQPCFFQKHVKIGLPKSVDSIEVPDKENPARSEPYIAINSTEALLGLAQLGVLELHPWGSRFSPAEPGLLEKPDRIILDLDPDADISWTTLAESACAIRDFLRELGLESFVKTTGGKGLHIVAALQPSAEWPEIRLFSRGIAAAVESSNPKLFLIKMTKAARKGRIFLDWMRNERGSTAVAPWSPRARRGMRAAVPLRWEELAAGPPSFAVANFADWRERISEKSNPWARMQPQRLDPEVLRTVVEQSAAAEKQRRR